MTETDTDSDARQEVTPPEVGEFGLGFHMTPPMAIERLQDTGLLWYINRVAFHPRGFALALNFEGAEGEQICTGWAVQATDGTEMITFEGYDEDEMFRKVEALFSGARLEANQNRSKPE